RPPVKPWIIDQPSGNSQQHGQHSPQPLPRLLSARRSSAPSRTRANLITVFHVASLPSQGMVHVRLFGAIISYLFAMSELLPPLDVSSIATASQIRRPAATSRKPQAS